MLKTKRDKPRRVGVPTPRIKPGRIEDPEHLKRVRGLPCLICGTAPSEAHHIRAGVGMGQKAGDREAIPLCSNCHRTGGIGVAFHAGPRIWVLKHGSERDFLDLTLEALKEAGAAGICPPLDLRMLGVKRD